MNHNQSRRFPFQNENTESVLKLPVFKNLTVLNAQKHWRYAMSFFYISNTMKSSKKACLIQRDIMTIKMNTHIM